MLSLGYVEARKPMCMASYELISHSSSKYVRRAYREFKHARFLEWIFVKWVKVHIGSGSFRGLKEPKP